MSTENPLSHNDFYARGLPGEPASGDGVVGVDVSQLTALLVGEAVDELQGSYGSRSSTIARCLAIPMWR